MSFILQTAAGGGTISMTAAGTISAGQPVIATAAGTAAQVGVTATGTTLVTQNNLTSSGLSLRQYSTAAQCYLAASGSSVRAGTYGVAGISWGTAATIGGTIVIYNRYPAIVLTGTSTFIICYSATTTNYPTVVAGTISGTTITLGTPVTVESTAIGSGSLMFSLAAVDSTRFVGMYMPVNAGSITTFAASVSGTTITLGTKTVTNETQAGGALNTGAVAAWDAASSRALFNWRPQVSGLGNYWACLAASISGTTLTYGSQVYLDGPSTGASIGPCAFDTLRNQLVFRGTVGGAARIVVVSVSGLTPSQGYSVSDSGAAGDIVYNSAAQLLVLGSTTTNTVTNSGSAFTFNAAGPALTAGVTVYDSDLNQVAGDSGSQFGIGKVGVTNLGTGNYVGIAQNAASVGGTVTINVVGSTASISGLTAGSNYGVLSVGGLAPVTSLTLGTYAGIATTNATLLLKG